MSLDIINPLITKIPSKKGGYCIVPISMISTENNPTMYFLVDAGKFGVTSLPAGYKLALKIADL